MKNPYSEGDRVSLLGPLDLYLKYCDEDPDYFASRLKEMYLPYIEPILAPLFHYGLIAILLPLNELIPLILADEEKLIQWRAFIKDMENSYIVFDNEDDFHTNVLKENHINPDHSAQDIWNIGMSYYDLMNMIWAITNDKVDKYLTINNALIGILTPGVYCYDIRAEFLALLDNPVLPNLLDELDNYSYYTHPFNKYEVAALKYIVKTFTQELGYQYMSLFRYGPHRVFKEANSEEALYQLSSKQLRDTLFFNSRIDDYITPSYLVSIDRLNTYVTNFNIRDYSNRSLGIVAPLLHQCIDENEAAYNLLLEILMVADKRFLNSDVSLLSLSRAVSMTRFEKRNLLMRHIIRIWDDQELPNVLIKTLKSIIGFFRFLSNEIPLRFQEKGLQSLIANADYYDRIFYRLYDHPSYGDDDIEALSTISPYIFENHAVVSRLELFFNTIQDTTLLFSTRLFALFRFKELFWTLDANTPPNIRIAIRACINKLANVVYPDSTIENEYPWYFSIKGEIFHVYSYSQQERLNELGRQLDTLSRDLPSFDTVQKYEKFVFFDKSERTEKEFKHLEERIEHVSIQATENTKAIMQLREEKREVIGIINRILIIASRDDEVCYFLFGVFVRQRDATLMLSESIHSTLKNSNLPTSERQALETFANMLEQVISKPEEYYKESFKRNFKDGFKALGDAMPFFSEVSSIYQAIRLFQAAVDDIEKLSNP